MWTADGIKVFHVDNVLRGQELQCNGQDFDIICTIPKMTVPAGHYMWNTMISVQELLATIYTVRRPWKFVREISIRQDVILAP